MSVRAESEGAVETSSVGPVLALYDVIAGKDVTAADALLDEASVLHVSGRSGLSGRYQGGDVILGLLRRMAELTDGTLRFLPSRILTAEEQAVVVCGHATASRLGRQLDTEEVHVVSLRDGKVHEIWIFHEDQGRIDEFWAAGGKPG